MKLGTNLKQALFALPLLLIPVVMSSVNIWMANTCCSAQMLNYGALDFLAGVLSVHSRQTSVTLLAMGAFALAYFLAFGIMAILQRKRALIYKAFTSFIVIVPLFVVLHLVRWFGFDSNSDVNLLAAIFAFLVLPIIWVMWLRLMRKLSAAYRQYVWSTPMMLFLYCCIFMTGGFSGLLFIAIATLLITLARPHWYKVG